VLANSVNVVAGSWTFTVATPLADGTYQIKAASLDGTAASRSLGDPGGLLRISHADLAVATAIRGSSSGDFFGRDMTAMGDFNGDGYADFAVAAPGADPSGRTDAGSVYVLFGGASGIDMAKNAWLEIKGATAGDGGNYTASLTVGAAGDVNGDGVSDLLIGASVAAAPSGADGGAVYVVYGSASASALGSIDLNTINQGNTTSGLHITHDPLASTSDHLGLGAGAGDINGDGYADIIIGAPYYDPLSPARPDAGAVFVVYGGAALGNLQVSQSTIGSSVNGFALWGANNANLGVATVKSNDVRLGENATSVGDVNGDGIADFVVTAPYSANYMASANGNQAGTAYLVYGKQGGLPTLDLNDFGYIEGARINAQHLEWLGGANNFPGHYARGLGDINGDGVGDFAITAPFSEPGDPGHIWVVYGQVGGYGSGINLDLQVPYNLPGGVSPGSSFNRQVGFLITNEDFTAGSTTNAHAGANTNDGLGFSIANAGDVNLDGLDDILVGAPFADSSSSINNDLGAVYILYGRQAGMGTNLISLADVVANPALGYVVRGSQAGDQFGSALALVDLNGDGLVDIAGSQALANLDGALSSGALFVFDGNTAVATNSFSAGSDTITAGAGVDRIVGGPGNDTITGLSTGDVAAGGQGNDVFTITSTDFARIDGGLGQDTLVLAGTGLALHPWQQGQRLQHIETIDLGQGGNSLTLSLTDALNLTDHSAQTLTIRGANGQVTLSAGLGGVWQDSGDITLGTTVYDAYHHTALGAGNLLGDIYIQQGLSVNANANAAPRGTTSTVNVNGDYQLRMSDFGFSDLDSGQAMSAVRINSGSHLFLNSAPVTAGTTVSSAQIISGQLQWHAPNLNLGVTLEPINFQVFDNFGSGTMADTSNTLTLSRSIHPEATAIDNGSRFHTDIAPAFDTNWLEAFYIAIASGGHLATFEGGAGNATAIADASARFGTAGYSLWLGLEQSSNGSEPTGGWHWSTGNTAITWAPGQPDGSSDNGTLWRGGGGTQLDDQPGTLLGRMLEYENPIFVHRGDPNLIDTMYGSSAADVIAGMGGADDISAGDGDDRILVPDMLFASVNGKAGFDVLEFTAAATITGAALNLSTSGIEALHLGAGNQALSLSAGQVRGLSSYTNTLYIGSDGSGDTLDLAELIGSAASQWHIQGTAHGLVTYRYFDASNTATNVQLLVDQTVVVG
jgi:hypothetical protein